MMRGKFPFHEMIRVLTKLFPQEAAPVITRLSLDTDRDPFVILVGTLLSLRTKDETTEKVMAVLMPRMKRPQDLIDIPLDELEKLIYPVGFYRNKAKGLKEVAAAIVNVYDGVVPDTIEELIKIRGVGRKTANLVVTEGYGKPGICVDTHVHRISNRTGAVTTRNPHQTEDELRKILPPQYWITYNALLVTFGKRICTPLSPKCSECPLAGICEKKGVTRSR